jgi:hypothetical protein
MRAWQRILRILIFACVALDATGAGVVIALALGVTITIVVAGFESAKKHRRRTTD